MTDKEKRQEELKEAMKNLRFGGSSYSTMLGATPSEIDHEDEFAQRPLDALAKM